MFYGASLDVATLQDSGSHNKEESAWKTGTMSKMFRIKLVPDEGVDALGGHVVRLLHRLLNPPLGGSWIADEDKGVGLLNLLHGAFSRQRLVQHTVLVVAVDSGDGIRGPQTCKTGGLGGPGLLEGAGAANKRKENEILLEIKRDS